jgi:hypothetical protein
MTVSRYWRVSPHNNKRAQDNDGMLEQKKRHTTTKDERANMESEEATRTQLQASPVNSPLRHRRSIEPSILNHL